MASDASSSSRLARVFPTFAGLFDRKNKDKGSVAPAATKRGRNKASAPKLPSVNLLPPRLELEQLRRSTRRGFMVAGVIIVITAGAVWILQSLLLGINTTGLDSASKQLVAVQSQTAAYSQVDAYYQAINARETFIKTQTVDAVNYGAVLSAVQSSTGGANLTSVKITALDAKASSTSNSTNAAASATSCGPKTDPFGSAATKPLACITFTGTVTDRTAIPQIAISLQGSPLFSDVSVAESAGSTNNSRRTNTAADTAVTFTGTAVINTNAAVGKG